jgi:PAS domain S-box-containing protein
MKKKGIGKKSSRKKILVRLTLMMIFLSIISGAIILGVALNEQKKMMKKNLIEDNKHLSFVAARSIEAGIYMKPLLEEINNSENVLFCWVVKPEGIIHLADDPDMSGKRVEGVPLEAEEAVVEDYVFRDEDIKIVVHPFSVADSEKTWKLCTGISLKSVNEAVNRMILTSLSFFFLIIAFACALSFFLARRFTEPITQLLEGTKAISRGEFDSQVKIKTGDEIEELGNAFNSMAQQIKKVISLEKEKTAREYIENMVNTMGETLIVVDLKGKVKKANKTTFDLLGYGEEEVIGNPINKILCQKEAREKLKMGKKSDGESFESTFSTKDGREIPVILSVSPIRDEDGEPKEIVCVGTNITERKRAEKEREKLLAEREAKNTELDRFTYTVSHDLRSPLITVQGFIEMLRGDLERDEKEKVENDLKFIENGTAKMDRLLTDTLQLSRIGRFVNPPEDVPFGEIVREAQVQTTEQIKSSGVEVSVAEDFPTVHVDRMRIVEVLVNLVTNSITYMGEQPRPKINIGYRVDEEEPVFFVRDNGIGIDPSQHEKVFELFYQIEKNNKGTGAGLAIVKRIIEVHEGRIWIEPEKGKGCTVCFTLPVHTNK